MAQVVLVADDSPTVQKRAQGILKGEGFDVETVSNGVAAIKKLALIHPSILLLDVSMPGRDGYEVCEFVKSAEEFRHIPVLLVASEMEPYDAERGSRVRADGKITKPFEPQELISMVTKFAAQAEAPTHSPSQIGESVAETPAAAELPPPESPAEETAEEGSPRADREMPHFAEDVAFVVPSDDASELSPVPPAPFQPEPQTGPPMRELPADTEEARAFQLWEAERPPAVPEPAIAPEPVEESEPAEAPDPWIAAQTDTETEPGVALEAALQPEEPREQLPESLAEARPSSDESPPIEEESPAAVAEAPAPAEASAGGVSEPVLIEEEAQRAAPEPSSPSTPERIAIFHSPAQIAEPVLNDELAPPVPEAESPRPVVESEPSSASSTDHDSFHLDDAAPGRIRFASDEPETTQQEETPPAEAGTGTVAPVPQPDWNLAYSIVRRVVERMSPPETSAERIEETARDLTNEIVGGLTGGRGETHS